ncbi:MAG TPA: hypothetical protein VMK53_06340 [Gemmatimonadales bacterium]|nr:hypothetical protein [Gemmatimonadales bacterium]
MLRSLLSTTTLMMLMTGSAAAQWSVGLEAGVDRVPRFAIPTDTETEGLRARPSMTWPLSLRLERGGEGPRLALSASRVDAGLELDDGEFGVVVRPGFRILTITPEASHRLASLAGGGSLRAHLALPLERWSFPGLADDPRWRLSTAAGLAGEFPMTRSLSVRISGQLGRAFGNPLDDSEMSEEYQPTTMWRRSARVGVVWKR